MEDLVYDNKSDSDFKSANSDSDYSPGMDESVRKVKLPFGGEISSEIKNKRYKPNLQKRTANPKRKREALSDSSEDEDIPLFARVQKKKKKKPKLLNRSDTKRNGKPFSIFDILTKKK